MSLPLISGRFTLKCTDSVSGTRCPRTAIDAQYSWLAASAGTRRFGRIMLRPTLDAQVTARSPACGKSARYRTSLAGPRRTLAVSETGPRLCLGNVGAAPRLFAVTGGTGRYAGASGSGSITVEVLDTGATEACSGAVYLRHKDEQ